MPDELVKLEYAPDRNPVSKIIDRLNNKIVGQPRAIKEIDYALQRSFAQIGDPERPLAILIFLGPSGVGKTETAIALSEVLKDFRTELLAKKLNDKISRKIKSLEEERDKTLNELSKFLDIMGEGGFKTSWKERNARDDIEFIRRQTLQNYEHQINEAKKTTKNDILTMPALVRIDCSNLAEHWNVTSLTSSSPGYVGSGKPGLLDPYKINNNPYLVVLFDEIEKADPAIYNILLSVFDNGILQLASPIRTEDSFTRQVLQEIAYIDFRQAIIIITGNIGREAMEKAVTGKGIVGFRTIAKNVALVEGLSDEAYRICRADYEKRFSREFRNRIDSMIAFNYLKPEHLRQILDLQLNEQQESITQNKGFLIKYTNGAKAFLLKQADHFEEQAWGLVRRVIERKLIEPLSTFINQNDIGAGDTVEIKAGEDKLEFYIIKKNNKKG